MTYTNCLLSIILLTHSLPLVSAESVKAMTFNVRYPAGNDKGSATWAARKEAVVATVHKYQPDFLGTQEVTEDYEPYLVKHLAKYSHFGRFRYNDGRRGDDGVTGNWDEACFLFYKTSRWQLVDGDFGTFQLSETPDVEGSGDWDVEKNGWGNDSRVVTWGRFREKATGMTLYVYNTHWDNRGPDDKPALLSVERIVKRKHPEDPVIYMGDLNAKQGHAGIDYMLGKNVLKTPPPIAMVDTDPGLIKIDHVFVLPATAEVIEAGRKEDRWDVEGYTNIRASDHWPILAEIQFWNDGPRREPTKPKPESEGQVE